jgi:diphthamide biosynthesis protein 7
MEAASLSKIDTDWPADSLEFCPRAGATDIFVCGTYKLEESKPPTTTVGQSETSRPVEVPQQRRKGKCLVFRTDENGSWWVIR